MIPSKSMNQVHHFYKMASFHKIDIAKFFVHAFHMPVKASTHRFDPEVQEALSHLSKALGTPKNRLINEAVKLYVEQRSMEVEKELEASLTALRAYRRKDPNFEKSMAAFVNAETQMAGADPLEGRIISSENSVRSEIQHLLHA